MFNMIGGDGREYGPVSADQLREWIRDHRANGQTMVRREGDQDWVPLGTLAEFAEDLAEGVRIHGTVSLATPPEIAPAGIPSSLSTATGPRAPFQVLDVLGRAWLVLQRHFFPIMAACAAVWAAQSLPQLLPNMFGCMGLLVSVAIAGAMYGGLCVYVLGFLRGRPEPFPAIFSCFDSRFAICLSVFVVTGLLEELGMALCLLPGVFLSTVWAFSLPLAADRRMGFAASIAGSWRAVMPRFFQVLGLLALAFLPVLVFSVYSYVRMMTFTVELLGPTGFNLASFREQLPNLAEHAGRLGLQQQLVLLLNLPFAWTAVMAAYEELFGTRPTPGA